LKSVEIKNLFIVNGRLDKDRLIGALTFRDKSVIDYAIVTAECFENIINFEIIETDALFSDGHSAINLTFKTPTVLNQPKVNHQTSKPNWKPELKQDFVNKIDPERIQTLTDRLIQDPQSADAIDYVTEEIALIFRNAAQATFPSRNTVNYSTKSKNKPWFGPKCNAARKNYHEAKQNYKISPNSDNKLRLQNASKQYKRTMNFYIKKYQTNNQSKLRNLSSKNPKQYWKFLNSLKPKQQHDKSPSLEIFTNILKT